MKPEDISIRADEAQEIVIMMDAEIWHPGDGELIRMESNPTLTGKFQVVGIDGPFETSVPRFPGTPRYVRHIKLKRVGPLEPEIPCPTPEATVTPESVVHLSVEDLPNPILPPTPEEIMAAKEPQPGEKLEPGKLYKATKEPWQKDYAVHSCVCDGCNSLIEVLNPGHIFHCPRCGNKLYRLPGVT